MSISAYFLPIISIDLYIYTIHTNTRADISRYMQYIRSAQGSG